jgi:hypothetical protein
MAEHLCPAEQAQKDGPEGAIHMQKTALKGHPQMWLGIYARQSKRSGTALKGHPHAEDGPEGAIHMQKTALKGHPQMWLGIYARQSKRRRRP